MYMIMFVLDDPNRLDALIEKWETVGIRGATIIESTGIQRRRKKSVPMRYVFQSGSPVEENHFTLFAIVPSEEIVQACLTATESLVGDLNQPDTGVFAAWALPIVKGVSCGEEKIE